MLELVTKPICHYFLKQNEDKMQEPFKSMILIKLCPEDFRAQGNELMPRLRLCFNSSQSHCREAKKNCEQFSFEIFRKKLQ